MSAPPRTPDATEPLAELLDLLEAPCGEAAGAVADLAATVLEQAFVHLSERRRSGFDPVPALDRLRTAPSRTVGEWGRRLLAVFARVGDRHTHCRLGGPFGDRIAFLPFRACAIEEAGGRRLVVTGSVTPELHPGDAVVSWGGAPATAAVEAHMAAQLGANPPARHAKAVQTLTLRPLALLPPPAEAAVTLEVQDPGGRRRAVELPWRVASAAALGPRLAPLFASDRAVGTPCGSGLSARTVETRSGTFAHLRVAGFDAPPERLLRDVLRALDALPAGGLLLDLRGCEDGLVASGEQLLQLFTDREIEPQRFQFRLTSLVRRLAATCPGLATWRAAVERAAERGAEYSEPLPLTSPEAANAVGRRYPGPVVVLVDALTYSTAEMVAAGFQDHAIAPVLGTAPSTGGGGGSPWSRETLHRLSGDPKLQAPADGTDLRVAVRRSLRTGRRAGEPLETRGVEPDHRHRPTRRDLAEADADLMERAGAILARHAARRARVHALPAAVEAPPEARGPMN